MSDFPPYGTSPIKCGKRGCGWTGKETDLIVQAGDEGKFAQQNVCPKCGCDSYTFVNPKAAKKAAKPRVARSDISTVTVVIKTSTGYRLRYVAKIPDADAVAIWNAITPSADHV